MENKFRKIVASFVLTVFVISNTLITVEAMENASKPALRNGSVEHTVKLKGDINFVNSNETISLSLRDSDVKQVLRMFADKAGMNIIFHNSVEGSVTMDLVDVPLNTAFDMVLNITNLNYTVDGNTIVVAKADAENFNVGKQEMTLIPVKYVDALTIAKFLEKNIFGMGKPGISKAGVVSINPATNELIIFGSKNDVALAKKVVEKFDVKPANTVFKVNHTTPAEMAHMVCSMLLPAAGAGGDGSGDSSTGGAAGVMTGAASDEGGGDADAEMLMNTGMVACYAGSKIDGDELTSVGYRNLTVSFHPQQGTVSVLGGSAQQIEMIREFIENADKKQLQAYLEVSIIELNEEGSKELQNTWEILSKPFSATFANGRTTTNKMYPMFIKGDGYRIVDVDSYKDGDYEEIGRAGKWQGPFTITYAINYLIQSGKGRVVVNPRVVITNGVKSRIEVTEDYVASVDVDSSTSTGGTVITREYNIEKDLGFTLSIMPFISPEGYVTLNIVPEYSTLKDTVTGNDPFAGTYTAATLLSHRNLDLKNLRIKDGETFIIAGMIQEKELKSIQKVPVLGDLPLIGAVFRNTTSAKSKSEMVIMLTPKIITDNEDAIGNADAL